MDSQPQVTVWYFDENNYPICQAIFTGQQCQYFPRCVFSHNPPKRSCYVTINEMFQNPHSMVQELTRQASQEGQFSTEDIALAYQENEPYMETPDPQYNLENDIENDIDQLDRLMKEMKHFEEGPDTQEKNMMCPFLVETGNCLIKNICLWVHSEDDLKQGNITKMQEWYPNSMSCECCKGFIYACQREECAKKGSCSVCLSEGVTIS
ncbi:unnamed protein product [Blepharisma stoltei]|uniref:C3H1-type domain-containing protein n=1 Tax=Blepharisma stoltei TaxID=1481888 RepID=A0AAU9JRS2_9CILI|nr:unnamed protein product [Blepharisma stoltei]